MNIKTKKYHVSIIAVLIGMALFSGSCSKDYFVPEVISEGDIQSFSTDIKPIFNNTCLGSGCHSVNGGVQPFLEDAIAYDNLIFGNYVDTLNPESSVLYERINAGSNFMPPASKLPSVDIQKILIWIKQGAKDN